MIKIGKFYIERSKNIKGIHRFALWSSILNNEIYCIYIRIPFIKNLSFLFIRSKI